MGLRGEVKRPRRVHFEGSPIPLFEWREIAGALLGGEKRRGVSPGMLLSDNPLARRRDGGRERGSLPAALGSILAFC